MARLWTCGFELNSTTVDVEFSWCMALGTQSIVTSPVRSGTYSLRVNPTSSNGGVTYVFAPESGIAVTYHRFYLRIATAPSANTSVYIVETYSGDSPVQIKLQTDRKLDCRDFYGAAGSLGISDALSLNSWYRVELKVNQTDKANTVIEAKLDGTTFASGTIDQTGLGNSYSGDCEVGYSNNVTTDIYYDDWAINDSTGSFQNSWPGEGKIIHLQTNAAGDNAQWTPDTGSNYARVSEVTPDDATSLVKANTLNKEDLYNCGASGLDLSDTINVIHVGGRFNNDTADATTAFKFEIEKAASGTISQSAAIVPNSTTWKTNAIATPYNYPLTLYLDPDNGRWTQATLDTMQIGAKVTTGGTNNIQVSTIWTLVDYTPNDISTNSGEMVFGEKGNF